MWALFVESGFSAKGFRFEEVCCTVGITAAKSVATLGSWLAEHSLVMSAPYAAPLNYTVTPFKVLC